MQNFNGLKGYREKFEIGREKKYTIVTFLHFER